MNATAKDLRFHSRELLDTVTRGEEVIITLRGKPCARLAPLAPPPRTKDPSELFGIWKDYKETEHVDDYLRSLRKGRF